MTGPQDNQSTPQEPLNLCSSHKKGAAYAAPKGVTCTLISYLGSNELWISLHSTFANVDAFVLFFFRDPNTHHHFYDEPGGK